MFGYVNICKDELRIKEYNLFRAHYCGLCKAIGKQGSHIARMGLSYDMTFLALVLSAVDKENISVRNSRCVAHPLRKHMEIYENKAIDYTANMSVLLAYLKLYDDWQDEHSIKALLGMLSYKTAVRKARKRYKKEYDSILRYLKELSRLEKEKCSEIDKVADCFANILKVLFTPDFIKSEEEIRVLEWLGYNTGRWIYIIDAFADIEKDVKSGSYNPLIMKYDINKDNVAEKVEEKVKEISEELSFVMDYTLSNIASAYELLNIHRNDEILRNIIYMGLRNKQDMIMKRVEEKTNESI